MFVTDDRTPRRGDEDEELWYDSWSDGPFTTQEVRAIVEARPRAAQEFHSAHPSTPHFVLFQTKSLSQ